MTKLIADAIHGFIILSILAATAAHERGIMSYQRFNERLVKP